MELYKALLEFYPEYKWNITNDDYNNFEWLEEDVPKPSEEELMNKCQELIDAQPIKNLRKERNKRLGQSDKYALPDWPHSSLSKQTEWLDYRQALRVLPTATEDPANPVWPTAPTS